MTERYDYEVFHTVSTAIRLLAQSCDMRIVGHSDCQSQPVAQHGSQGDNALPWQIGCIFYTIGNRAGTGRTDTHGADSLNATVLLDKHDNLLTQHCREVIDVTIISRIEIILCYDIPPDVNYGKGCSLKADIYAHNAGLDFVYGIYQWVIIHVDCF